MFMSRWGQLILFSIFNGDEQKQNEQRNLKYKLKYQIGIK